MPSLLLETVSCHLHEPTGFLVRNHSLRDKAGIANSATPVHGWRRESYEVFTRRTVNKTFDEARGNARIATLFNDTLGQENSVLRPVEGAALCEEATHIHVHDHVGS